MTDKKEKGLGGVPPKRRLKSADDCRRFLADLINRLNRGEVDSTTAGRLGYLTSTLVGVLKETETEARLSALEQAAKEKSR